MFTKWKCDVYFLFFLIKKKKTFSIICGKDTEINSYRLFFLGKNKEQIYLFIYLL